MVRNSGRIIAAVPPVVYGCLSPERLFMLQKRRTHPVLLALIALLLTAAGPRPAAPPQDPEVVRRDLALLLNRERELAGVPLLSPAGPLHAVAQARAEAIQAHGGLPDEAEAM